MALQFPKDKRRVLGIAWVELAPDGSEHMFQSSAGLADTIPLKAVSILQLTLRQAIQRLMLEGLEAMEPGSVGDALITPAPAPVPDPPKVVPVEVKDPAAKAVDDKDKGN